MSDFFINPPEAEPPDPREKARQEKAAAPKKPKVPWYKQKKYIISAGIAVIVIAAAGYYIDKHRPGLNLNQNLPDDGQLQDYGTAPEFTGISKWINSPALTMASLKGKVVLLDFWTYSCINCLRTLPDIERWNETYGGNGLVVIGVHTPEFGFEKDTKNVQDAVDRLGINYPVAQDNDYATWDAYSNQYWPAEYLVDKNGELQFIHFGEGNTIQTENAIRKLLGLKAIDPNSPGEALGQDRINDETLSQVQSPEMYFEPDRIANLIPQQQPSDTVKYYSYPTTEPPLNYFQLGGSWKFADDGAITQKSGDKLRLKFHSGKIHLVAASSGAPVTLHITVDAKVQKDVMVSQAQLYTLFDSSDYIDHIIEITIDGANLEMFTFTFG